MTCDKNIRGITSMYYIMNVKQRINNFVMERNIRKLFMT